MMKIDQKDIVLLSHKFSDLSNRKVRPALVISNNFLNNKSEDCIAAPLTSVIKDISYSILISNDDMESGELLKASRIRVDKIFSMEKDLVIKKIGKLKNETFEKVRKEFLSLI